MTKSELNSCRELQRKIAREQSRIESLRDVAHSMQRILDGVPHARPQSSKPERFTMLVVEAEERLSELQNEFDTSAASLATKLTAELSAQSPLCLTVALKYYVGCLSISAIARTLHYTKQHIFNARNRVLEHLGIDRPTRTPTTELSTICADF